MSVGDNASSGSYSIDFAAEKETVTDSSNDGGGN